MLIIKFMLMILRTRNYLIMKFWGEDRLNEITAKEVEEGRKAFLENMQNGLKRQ